LSEDEIDRIVGMAWEDRTPFDAITAQFGLSEAEVIELMRRQLKPSSWRHWRAHVNGRETKHAAKRGFAEGRHRSPMQRTIAHHKISKRKG
jgi:uncharacterized protein (TIGR03643 family)